MTIDELQGEKRVLEFELTALKKRIQFIEFWIRQNDEEIEVQLNEMFDLENLNRLKGS